MEHKLDRHHSSQVRAQVRHLSFSDFNKAIMQLVWKKIKEVPLKVSEQKDKEHASHVQRCFLRL